MSINNWTFSPSSAAFLQRCISAAPPPDANNKWFQKFGKKDSPVETDIKVNADANLNINSLNVEEDTINCEEFFETIENESTIPVEYILEECTKKPALITKMVEKLPTNTVEHLFHHIFSKKLVENQKLTMFITKFLPAFMKKQSSRLCVDLLVKINEESPHIFKELLQILINDTEIPNQILNSYIGALNEESNTTFLKTLSTISISSEGFTQNVVIICTAYKNCIKDDFIQKYVENIIIEHSRSCMSDRNFGRMFLTFLQSEKEMGRKINIDVLKRCLDAHSSPFKRPCTLLLNEI